MYRMEMGFQREILTQIVTGSLPRTIIITVMPICSTPTLVKGHYVIDPFVNSILFYPFSNSTEKIHLSLM